MSKLARISIGVVVTLALLAGLAWAKRDLSAEHPEKVAALERALAAHDAEQEPSRWLPSISRAITIDKDLTVPEATDAGLTTTAATGGAVDIGAGRSGAGGRGRAR